MVRRKKERKDASCKFTLIKKKKYISTYVRFVFITPFSFSVLNACDRGTDLPCLELFEKKKNSLSSMGFESGPLA